MRSEIPGKSILRPEILNVSPHGFWLMVAERECFMGFTEFPWFRTATLQQLFNVELHHQDHLFWPELDVDLERVVHPEKFPLIAKH